MHAEHCSCYELNVCSPNSHVDILTLMMKHKGCSSGGVGDEVLRGKSLKGVSALLQETPENSPVPSLSEDTESSWHTVTQSCTLTRT